MQRGNGAVIGKQNTPTTSVATGVWALNEVQRAVLNGTWPAATIVDPYFENVSLLLHGNGTNGAQNNTFLDSSTNNFTITRNGNTTQGAFTPYGANWSNYFDGSGDYLRYATNTSSQFSLGTGDFTDEAWVFPTAFAGGSTVISIQTQTNVGAGNSYALYLDSTGRPGVLAAASSGGYAVNFLGTAIPLNTWTHLAVTRSGNTFTLWRNGVSDGTATSSVSITQDTTSGYGGWNIGGSPQTGQSHNGYISNARLVKGTAVYTAAFTPSTSPLTAITNTSLLTCQSNRFIDNSSNNFAITRNGDVSVQRFSPFNPTAAYSAATIGGSGYFDGSGDYLNGPTTGQFAPTGDFTISMWFYPTSFAASYYVLAGSWNAGASDEWLIQYDNTGAIRFLTTTDSTFSAAGVVKLNQWQFLSISRSGSTVTGYINGTSFRSYTLTGTVGSATKTVYVGIQAGTTWPYVGYISDYRLVAGSAQSATPPTSPATAISGTNTLLSFTNGGIIDNAMMNNLETVGNAQISTSVSKFGGGSLAFDGSGDWLNMLTTPNITFGSGDFTFEGWLYLNSVTGTQIIFDQRPASTQGVYPVLYMNAAVMTWYINTTATITSSSLSTGVWYHFAVCRSSGSTRMFINGVQNGSTYADTNNYLASRSYIGISAFDQTGGLNGYIDDLRITKGYARYTANFTAPTLPFPDQ